MMLSHHLKHTAGASHLSTLGGQMKTSHGDSSAKQIRVTANPLIDAEKFTYSKGILKPKESYLLKERPRTQAHSKIGNYMVSEEAISVLEC